MLFRESQQGCKPMDHFKAIDWEETIKLVNNKPKLAEEMLSMLIAELPITRGYIADAMKEKNHKLLHKHIHRLHGACCYISLPRLKPIIIQLECILKSNEKQGLEAPTNKLLEEIEQILVTYKTETDNFRA